MYRQDDNTGTLRTGTRASPRALRLLQEFVHRKSLSKTRALEDQPLSTRMRYEVGAESAGGDWEPTGAEGGRGLGWTGLHGQGRPLAWGHQGLGALGSLLLGSPADRCGRVVPLPGDEGANASPGPRQARTPSSCLASQPGRPLPYCTQGLWEHM